MPTGLRAAIEGIQEDIPRGGAEKEAGSRRDRRELPQRAQRVSFFGAAALNCRPKCSCWRKRLRRAQHLCVLCFLRALCANPFIRRRTRTLRQWEKRTDGWRPARGYPGHTGLPGGSLNGEWPVSGPDGGLIGSALRCAAATGRARRVAVSQGGIPPNSAAGDRRLLLASLSRGRLRLRSAGRRAGEGRAKRLTASRTRHGLSDGLTAGYVTYMVHFVKDIRAMRRY